MLSPLQRRVLYALARSVKDWVNSEELFTIMLSVPADMAHKNGWRVMKSLVRKGLVEKGPRRGLYRITQAGLCEATK